jgi:hypothetical protein
MQARSSLVLVAILLGCGGASPPVDVAPPNPQVAPPTRTQDPPAASAAPTGDTHAAPIATASAAPSIAPSAAPSVAPSAAPSVARTDPPAGTPGANLNIASMDVNGLKVSNLSCRLDDVGFMTAAMLVGSLAKQKTALKACGKDQPTVEWTIAGGKVKDVKVTAKNAAIEKCIAKAMASVQAPVEGKCSAVLLLDP